MVKGYRFGRSTKKRMAKEAIFHAGKYAFAHRRDKKNDLPPLCLRPHQRRTRRYGQRRLLQPPHRRPGQKEDAINRKMLAELAQRSPESFARLIKQVA
jgi:large subunit ribosomal protein L20